MRRVFLQLLSVPVLLLLAWPALADDPRGHLRTLDPNDQSAARRAFEEGRAAYDLGNFPAAVQWFEEAYRLSHRRQLLWNVGLSYRRQFEVDHDVARLRQARQVFENFARQASPDEQSEAAEAAQECAEREAHEEVAVQRQDGKIQFLPVLTDIPAETPTKPPSIPAPNHPPATIAPTPLVPVVAPPPKISPAPTIPPASPAPASIPKPSPSENVAPVVTPLIAKTKMARPKWFWPAVGAGAAAVVVAVIWIAVAASATDYSALARARCSGSCVAIDGTQ